MNKYTYITIWVMIMISVAIMFNKSQKDYTQHKNLLQENLYQEAKAHFNDLVITRKWNASHDGIYVIQKDGIKPNPYLINNKIDVDNNLTFVKINAAWMTRQISETAQKNNTSFLYRITSTDPLNPSNFADNFEREALTHFKKNKDENFYARFGNQNEPLNQYNFMGKLNAESKCITCHPAYEVGDILGGIRVSVPTNTYNTALEHLNKQLLYEKLIVLSFNILIGLLLTMYFRKINSQQEFLSNMNHQLELKVQERTKSLDELNASLEERIKKEVSKSKQNEELMISQSRHAAMGEMINMLAHQWRQPIAIVEMGVNNMLIDLELGDLNEDSIKKELKDITVQTQRLSKIISDFSQHFKESDDAQETLCKNILENVIDVVSSSLNNNNIEIQINVSSEHPLFINSQRLFQVYLTLITNAKDIIVERNSKERIIYVNIEEDNRFVITKICDTGGGIKVTPIEQVFEPYFTTKKSKEGTGLGLYMAKMIVEKQFNGKLDVKNEGEKACLILSIPK